MLFFVLLFGCFVLFFKEPIDTWYCLSCFKYYSTCCTGNCFASLFLHHLCLLMTQLNLYCHPTSPPNSFSGILPIFLQHVHMLHFFAGALLLPYIYSYIVSLSYDQPLYSHYLLFQYVSMMRNMYEVL